MADSMTVNYHVTAGTVVTVQQIREAEADQPALVRFVVEGGTSRVTFLGTPGEIQRMIADAWAKWELRNEKVQV